MKNANELTEEEIAELDRELDNLLLMTDDEIDTSDIPETATDWSKAVRGWMLYPPEKLETQLVLDDFVIDWFKEYAADERDFPQYVSDVLRDHVHQRQNRMGREHRALVVREARDSGKITAEKATKLEAEMAEEALPPYEPVSASEIAEVLEWHKVAHGVSRRPVKQEIGIELDDYVINWLQENSADGQDFCEEINLALWKHIWKCQIFEPRESEWKRDRQRQLRERKEAVAHIMRRIQEGSPGLQTMPDKE